METFFAYQIKSSVCIFFYELFYRLFLRGDNFHRLKRMILLISIVLSLLLPYRMILLMSLVLSLLLPLLDVSGWFSFAGQDGAMPVTELTFSLQELVVDQRTAGLLEHQGIAAWAVIFGVYLAGIILLLLKNLLVFVYLHRLLKRCRQEQTADGQVYYRCPDRMGPFSWLGRVVLSSADDGPLTDCILAHERAHAALGHSFDLLLVELFLCFQWFNPAAWWLKKDLRLVHEYEADRYVLASGFDARAYQLLLIRKSVGPKLYNMVHSFNNYSLKKRITMMMKRKSKFWTQAKSLYVLPLGGFVLALFACVDGKKPTVEESQSVETREMTVKEQPDDSVASYVDPSFPGGDVACMKWLSENVKYPAEAVEKGIKGKVIVQFVVTKDGKITDAEVARSVDPLLDAEALRAIRSMPDWEPAQRDGQNIAVKYSLPIAFSLQ